MSAPELSPDELDVVYRFETADDLPESLRLRVMQATHTAACMCGEDVAGNTYWQRIADAAIATLAGDPR